MVLESKGYGGIVAVLPGVTVTVSESNDYGFRE
jgi:hypothetical protein